MTLVIYREDNSIEHIQCDLKEENALAMFAYRQSKYTETLHYDLIKANLTPREFKQFYYVVYPDGALRRPEMTIAIDSVSIAADGVDKATLSGCPVGAEVSIGGEVVGVVDVDGSVEVSSTLSKKILLSLSMYPYMPWKGEVNAT